MKNKLKPMFVFMFVIVVVLFCWRCEPLVDTIPEARDGEPYFKTDPPFCPPKDTLLVMTWNIRFGCGSEILWFGDACGKRTVLTAYEVMKNLDRIVAEINKIRPDLILLQEVDMVSKRSAYIDEMKYIMDRTYFGYGYYATNWKSQFIPSDGIGRLDEGNAVLSVYPIMEGKLTPLPLRNDIDALTRYFYVRESVLQTLITMPDNRSFYAVNTHLSAFSTDDTKQRQLLHYISICDSLSSKGRPLITGGDYNLLPPNADSLDYCFEDTCPGEHFHDVSDEPIHKEGSNYAPEITWLSPLYNKYYPSLLLMTYKENESNYFTHTTNPESTWDRTLDYLFSNRPFVPNSHKAWQGLRKHSDHAPVTALWVIKK